jgi:hypothetical protein
MSQFSKPRNVKDELNKFVRAGSVNKGKSMGRMKLLRIKGTTRAQIYFSILETKCFNDSLKTAERS